MALTASNIDHPVWPRWPEEPFDLARSWLRYGAYGDELVLYFSPRPVPAISDGIEAPEGGDTAILVGEGADAGKVVGIHVFPLLAGPAQHRPAWRRLAEPDPPAELVARFVAEVRDLFERHWAPAPPIAEQLAAIRRGRGEEPSSD